MSIYSYAEVRQQFEQLFEAAKTNEDVIIRSPNGDFFLLRMLTQQEIARKFPQPISDLSRNEIVAAIREVRDRS
ncbi:hypothetical protein U14_00632 [Candidatus Moduliflexus flocculans]|uniref:Prevent-host-death family protein n=1 Tax=Candidatus Moduliflexus flocculans TaxID=1499966 RepID=A0A0S6VQP4_9BACT|nr:hypothetical protein U14_00632 [Candidatus Moduliflexus flocculans]